jgi:hypothetical protein
MTRGKIGDKVGYRVVQLHAGYWVETDCPSMDTIGQAAGMLENYQQDDPAGTYAIAKQELVMISRPTP